jgi:acyl carrier protein
VDLQEKVIGFIREYFALHDHVITGESRLRKDLGLSSFELLEMCCTIEEEFNVTVSESNLRQVVTINDVVTSLYRAT